MRITIESSGPGLYRLAAEQDGEVKRGELLTRTEVARSVMWHLWRENKRNGVKDRQPLEDRIISVPIPSWLDRWFKHRRK